MFWLNLKIKYFILFLTDKLVNLPPHKDPHYNSVTVIANKYRRPRGIRFNLVRLYNYTTILMLYLMLFVITGRSCLENQTFGTKIRFCSF